MEIEQMIWIVFLVSLRWVFSSSFSLYTEGYLVFKGREGPPLCLFTELSSMGSVDSGLWGNNQTIVIFGTGFLESIPSPVITWSPVSPFQHLFGWWKPTVSPFPICLPSNWVLIWFTFPWLHSNNTFSSIRLDVIRFLAPFPPGHPTWKQNHYTIEKDLMGWNC